MSLRILFITPYVPNIVRVRPFNFIRALANRGHRVSLLAIDDGTGYEEDLATLRASCEQIETVPLSKPRVAWNMLRTLPTRKPLQSEYAWQAGVISSNSQGRRILGDIHKYDVIHIEHMRAARYGLALKEMMQVGISSTPIVFDSVDCLSALFRQTAVHAAHLFNRWIAKIELGRNERYEAWLLPQFERVLVTSELDRQALLQLDHVQDTDASVSVVPNGVDFNYFSMVPQPVASPDTIIMTGKMSYHANIAMCHHFVADILPQIWRKKPEVKLLIVGKDPPAAIRAYSRDPRIVVTGKVPDLRKYFAKATVAVAPLVYGVGIQNKVLEAMSCGIPVVTTSRVTEALQVLDGRELLVANHPAEFAECVLRLIENRKLRSRISAAGRSYVELNHDWNRVAKTLEEIYIDVINS